MCGWTPHERGEGRTACLWRKKARVDQDFWSSVCWPWRWAEWVSIGRGICLVKRVNQQSWFQRLWITAHLHKKEHKRQKSVPLRGAESSFKGGGWMWLSWKVNRKIQDWKAGGNLRSGSPWLGSKGCTDLEEAHYEDEGGQAGKGSVSPETFLEHGSPATPLGSPSPCPPPWCLHRDNWSLWVFIET